MWTAESANHEINDILMEIKWPWNHQKTIHIMDEWLSLKSNYLMIDYYINYMWSLFFVLDDLI